MGGRGMRWLWVLPLAGVLLGGCCDMNKCPVPAEGFQRKADDACPPVVEGAPLVALPVGASRCLEMDAAREGQPLGMTLVRGERYKFAVTVVEPLWDCSIPADPDHGNQPLQKWNERLFMSLVGLFKKSRRENNFVLLGRWEPTGEWFKVGSGGEFTVTAASPEPLQPELILNDVAGYYCNNRGKLWITVTHMPN